MNIVERLRQYAAALRVAGTDESAELSWREFVDAMDRNTRDLVDRDDLEWTMALARHCYEAGWHAGLHRAAKLASRSLERVS